MKKKKKKIEDTIASMSEEYKEMNKAIYRKIEEHLKVMGESMGDGEKLWEIKDIQNVIS